MLNQQKLTQILSHLFVFIDIIGQDNLNQYRYDIELMIEELGNNKSEKNITLQTIASNINIHKYLGDKRVGEGALTSGMRSLTSAFSSVSSTLFGNDDEAIKRLFSLDTIFIGKISPSLMLEVMLESSIMWEQFNEKINGATSSSPKKTNEIKTHEQVRERLNAYKKLIQEESNMHDIIRRLYMRYANKEEISEWTKFYINILDRDYSNLIGQVRILLANRLDDQQLPKVLMKLQNIVDEFDRTRNVAQLGGCGCNKPKNGGYR